METISILKHCDNFHIAGFTFHKGCMTLSELKIGSRLRLVREEDNKFDPFAVAI